MPANNTDITISVMLFEGGALIEALSDKPQGAALARRIEDADNDALAAGQLEFEIGLNPIEVGMAFEAVSNSNSLLSNALSGKLRDALKAKLDQLGVSYGGSHPVGSDTPTETGEAPDGQETPADSSDETISDEDGQDSL